MPEFLFSALISTPIDVPVSEIGLFESLVFQKNVSLLLLHKFAFGCNAKFLRGILEFQKLRTSARLERPCMKVSI